MPPARADMPILVASKMPRMLELTARHADAWNLAWFGLPDERLARIRGELRRPATASAAIRPRSPSRSASPSATRLATRRAPR